MTLHPLYLTKLYSFVIIVIIQQFIVCAAVLSVCFCYELLFLLFKVFHFQFFVFLSLFNYYFFYKTLISFFFFFFLVFTLNQCPAVGIFYLVSLNSLLLLLGSSGGAFSSSISKLVVLLLFSIVFYHPLLLSPVLHSLIPLFFSPKI